MMQTGDIVLYHGERVRFIRPTTTNGIVIIEFIDRKPSSGGFHWRGTVLEVGLQPLTTPPDPA